MGNLSSAMKRLVQAVRVSTDARRSALRELRSATRTSLQQYQRDRRKRAREARRRAWKQVMEIRHTSIQLRRATRLAMGSIASDVHAATQLWNSTAPKRDFSPPAATRVVEKPLNEKPELSDRERVLRIIQAHEDGIRLVDMGNQLGVDWRSLIGVTKALLEEGSIEKIDALYYPVED
jgi:hypothetical protein